MPYKDPEGKRAYQHAYYQAYRQTHAEELKAQKHAWYVANRTRARARKKAYRERHAAELRAKKRAAYRANLDRERARAKTYRDTHTSRQRAYNAAYQQAHRERLLAQKAAYRQVHREELRLKEQARREDPTYRARSNASRKAGKIRWRQAHPELNGEAVRRRYARTRGAPVADLTRTQWEAIKRAFNDRCAYCGTHQKRLTQDHITPLSAGGSHTMNNVVPACIGCNSKKWIGKPPRPVQPLLLA
jgi:5-methylcytosine-specific restriction endonuclease McrA